MQKLTIAVIGAASLFALPVLAQTNSTTTSPSTTGSNSSASNQPMSQADMSQLQQKITSDMQKDGYKDVRVVPNSFLIHARNKEGQPVVMIINPNSVFAVTSIDTANGTGNPSGVNNGAGSSLGSNNNLTHNGTSSTTHQ